MFVLFDIAVFQHERSRYFKVYRENQDRRVDILCNDMTKFYICWFSPLWTFIFVNGVTFNGYFTIYFFSFFLVSINNIFHSLTVLSVVLSLKAKNRLSDFFFKIDFAVFLYARPRQFKWLMKHFLLTRRNRIQKAERRYRKVKTDFKNCLSAPLVVD